jgi:hypothetical protein
MKKYNFLTPTFIFICLQNIFAQPKESDTLFIFKDSIDGYAQSIFFETNTNSKFYDALTSFKFSDADKESYSNSITYLKKKYKKLTTQKTVLPFTNWIMIKQYKGQYCAYHPCDGLGFYRATINDTTFIDWETEGCEANKIISQKKITKNIFELNTEGYAYKKRTITFTIINQKKGIAVVETDAKDSLKDYYLMIRADKIKTVPFIINNCQYKKQQELKFDEINFKVLLNRVKSYKLKHKISSVTFY